MWIEEPLKYPSVNPASRYLQLRVISYTPSDLVYMTNRLAEVMACHFQVYVVKDVVISTSLYFSHHPLGEGPLSAA